MGPIASIEDLIDMMRRRAPVMMSIVILGSIISLFFALSQPRVYRAVEVIQVARPTISDGLAKTTVDGSAARRLQQIEHRLLARDNILAVIEKFGLFADTPGLSSVEKVTLIRQSVSIEGVAAAREGYSDDGSMSILRISADHEDPEMALNLAREFSESTVSLSRANRIEQARETLEFLIGQEQGVNDEIAVLEAEISEFRNANNLAILGSSEDRRSEISDLDNELLNIGRQIIQIQRASEQADQNTRQATAERLRTEYAEQITTLEAQRRLLLDRKAELESSLVTSPDVERQMNAYARKLQQLNQQQDIMSARRAEAEVGFRLETERQAEHLTVLEPAQMPEYPVSGGRKKLAVLGGGLSVFLAFVVAYILELRNPVIRSARQMERELGFLPVVSIPVMDTAPKANPFMRRLFGGGSPGKRQA